MAEDPRIGGGSAADHHRIAAGLLDHAQGIGRAFDIAIADHGHAHGLLHLANHVPIGHAIQTLQARARVHGDGFDAEVFGHARYVYRDDGFFVPAGLGGAGHLHAVDRGVVPAGADLNREWDGNGAAHGGENFSQERQIAQQTRAAALHHFFRRAAEVDIDDVEA